MEDHSFQDKDKLAEDLNKMLEHGSLNDVQIKLSDGEIVANKDILMASKAVTTISRKVSVI